MQESTYNKGLVALFDSREAAENARRELIGHGLPADQVEIAPGDEFALDAASGNAALGGRHRESSGGGIAGFFRRLFGAEDHDDYDYYSRELRGNRCAVIVHAEGELADRAAGILNHNGAIEVQHESDAARTGETSGSIPVVNEELTIGKRAVQRGAVRVYSRLEKQPVEQNVNLREERVRVERRPVDRDATDADIAAAERGVIEVHETVEEPVVEKRSRVVEEVHVTKDVKDRTETVRDSVRRSDVQVEDAAGADASYRYGYEVASDPRYRGRHWDEVENDLRRDYARLHPESAWDRAKDSVRRGWDKVMSRD